MKHDNQQQPQHTLLKVQQVSKNYARAGEQALPILQDVNLEVRAGEIVALLGRSGSGKSTMLRMICGLTKPSHGQLQLHGETIDAPPPGLAMIFQNFALLPWLTVLQNVELGLEARGVKRSLRRQRALKAIDIVGLDGFESAYPKELSGGMCQRVGFARALVVDPEILLMDEAFSALDVLTADNLRNDLLNIWLEKKTKLKSIFMITHNIEEAVQLADRVLILGGTPSQIQEDLSISLPHRRDSDDPRFRALVDYIYTVMTSPGKAQTTKDAIQYKMIGIGHRLPQIEVSELLGFLEAVYEIDPRKAIDLPQLAEDLHLEVDDLFPIMEACELMRLAQVTKGDIKLTQSGCELVQDDILKRKEVFANLLMNYVPLARHIKRVLDERPNQRANEERFLRELEDYLSEKEAENVLRVVIDWARYAELFAYDFNSGVLSLENPQ